MENVCNANHLDADVLLPPRKRLLAGLKKQSLDGETVPCASFSGSGSASPSSFVDTSFVPTFSSSDFNNRLKNLVSSHPNNSNLKPEEIIEASKSAAVLAMKAAEAARAAAEEKAAIAAKAIAAAKSALDLASLLSEEAGSKERNLKKNKLKKNLPVQLLYKKYQPMENCGTDEELARKLHRAINSSPRISKNCSNSDLKTHKYNKRKSSTSYEIPRIAEGGKELEEGHLSLCNGHEGTGKADSEDTVQNVCSSKDKRTKKYEKSNQMVIDDEEAESSFSKEKNCEENYSMGKRRGRVKLKKLPLSICTTKDKAHAKEDILSASRPSTEINTDSHTGFPLFPMEASPDDATPIETTSTCKSQEFNAPVCINQSKVVQS